MGINIWLPIITNLIIVSIITIGVLAGKKHGAVHELIKLLTILVCGTGLYFVMPLLYTEIFKISFVQQLLSLEFATVELVKAICLTASFLIVYTLISLVFFCISKAKAKKQPKIQTLPGRKYVNSAQLVKVNGVNKKETKKLRKEQKKFIKERKKQEKELKKINKPQLSKKQKGFGIVLGIILSIVIGLVVTAPLKYIFKEVAESQPSISEVTKGYEYTIYGQIDNATNIIDIIINK